MKRSKHSAGILLYRLRGGAPEVLLVLPGGPFWRNKDIGAWQIPKGAIEDGEDLLAAALREFEEELGVRPAGEARPLARIRQAGGKLVDAYAIEGDLDPDAIVSCTFELEWPPRSGKLQSFPEVARAQWFALDAAREAMLPSQLPLLDTLKALLCEPR